MAGLSLEGLFEISELADDVESAGPETVVPEEGFSTEAVPE